jgi:hypothetical protein
MVFNCQLTEDYSVDLKILYFPMENTGITLFTPHRSRLVL